MIRTKVRRMRVWRLLTARGVHFDSRPIITSLSFPTGRFSVVFWFYVGLLLAVPPLLYGLALAVMYLYVRWKYMGFLTRIFQEKPLFVIPRGEPDPNAEEVTVPAADGLALRGCYLRTTAAHRRGV